MRLPMAGAERGPKKRKSMIFNVTDLSTDSPRTPKGVVGTNLIIRDQTSDAVVGEVRKSKSPKGQRDKDHSVKGKSPKGQSIKDGSPKGQPVKMLSKKSPSDQERKSKFAKSDEENSTQKKRKKNDTVDSKSLEKNVDLFFNGQEDLADISGNSKQKSLKFFYDLKFKLNQCCGSGMIYSGSNYEILKFRIQPILCKHIWKLLKRTP